MLKKQQWVDYDDVRFTTFIFHVRSITVRLFTELLVVVYKHVDIQTFAQVSVYRFARPEDRPTKFTTPTHAGFVYRYDDVIEYVTYSSNWIEDWRWWSMIADMKRTYGDNYYIIWSRPSTTLNDCWSILIRLRQRSVPAPLLPRLVIPDLYGRPRGSYSVACIELHCRLSAFVLILTLNPLAFSIGLLRPNGFTRPTVACGSVIRTVRGLLRSQKRGPDRVMGSSG